MKILFLDIDGVLNSHDYWTRRTPEQRTIEERGLVMGGIDPLAIARLNRIVEETNAMIVVSSTIRRPEKHTRTGFQEHFSKHGFTGTVLGKTPVIPGDQVRGREIDAWLKTYHRPVEAFAIVDDDSDMEPHMDRLVKTSTSTGLLDEHVEKIVELLMEH